MRLVIDKLDYQCMQQIVFKRKFSVLFDAVKTENVQYFEKKKDTAH